MLSYYDEYGNKVLNLKLIAERYLKSEFLTDLIPLLPLELITLKNDRQ